MKMPKLLNILVFICLASVFAAGQEKAEAFVKDEVLIKFRGGTDSLAAADVLQRTGAALLEELGDLGWRRVKLPPDLTVSESIARFKESAVVESVQPNFYYRLQVVPNDTQYGSLWAMPKISAPQAWDLNTGSPNVVVAVIDTGVRYTHEDLAANMWTNPGETGGNGIDDDGNGFVDDVYGYDFYSNDADPIDETTGFGGHGTHTSGTIGAVGNNAVGVAGINWAVRIMAIKIYSPAGTDTTSAMLINAYNYVRMMKNRGVNIRVTNNSYGGCNEACGYDQATKDSIDALGNAGILNVFAAGNNGSNNDITPHFPSNYTSPSVLAVANSTSTDARAGSSNFGPVSVDLAAPGTGILSTYRSGYQNLSGTSMATPHVAGAAALLSAHNPALSPQSLKATIMNTVDVLSQWNGVVRTGGRLNVFNALQNQTVCTFNLSGQSISVHNKGGYFSVNVTAPQNCDYAVKSNVNWIHISGPDAMSGNGTVTFRVRFNPLIKRTGTISIAGHTFTVTQSRV